MFIITKIEVYQYIIFYDIIKLLFNGISPFLKKEYILKKLINSFINHEAAGGMILLFFAVLALIIANSPLAHCYEHLLHQEITLGFSSFGIEMSFLHWINDGLMVIFFFVVGMEIKREFLYGELKSLSATIMPITAAIGGMIVPAILYFAVNAGLPTAGGWGIPMATDIAFALGVIMLVARNAPPGLVVFLTALAIVDDLGAIVVIALFYSTDVSFIALASGLAALLVAFIFNRMKVKSFIPYLLAGLVAWYAFLNAGIHPTIAGVLLGFTIPAGENSLLEKLEHALAPWSSFFVMPVFALANAGVSVSGGIGDIFSPIGIGIILGLCVGKPLGICGAVMLIKKLFKGDIPGKARKLQLIATGALGGIGFTMSIFIASLAMDTPHHLEVAKLSILCASLLSGIIGMVLFKVDEKLHKS